MLDPTTDIRTGTVAKLQTDLVTAGYAADSVYLAPDPSAALPYVELKDFTITSRHNKTHDGTDATQLFICWGKTATQAQNLAATVLSSLTDRTSPISVASTTNLITYLLDSMGPMYFDDTSENDSEHAFAVPLRLRYRTHE